MRGDDLVRLARIVAPRGLRGEVRIVPYTGDPKEMEGYGSVLIGEVGGGYSAYEVEWVRRTGPHRFALKLRGVDDRHQAEALRGCEVAVERRRLPATSEDEYYWHDLLGMRVVTVQGEDVGRVESILETGANDVYVVRQEGREVLIPAIAQVVVSVDVEAGIMVVDPLPGLLDVNAPRKRP